ncbi:MAG TPA: NADPH-dependent oxidoreductase [Acetobacteraceae bacterium]|nr:NADPH-dependent oxidoreductase [Acetobacteraceae bacterium]
MSIARTPPAARDAAHALLSRRNRDGALDVPAHWNDVVETILNHRSVRGFLPDALPAGTLELLIAAAQSASTSSNLQLWSVVAIEAPSHKSRLATLAGDQQFIRDAPLLLVWLADLARIDAIAAERQQTVEGTQYLEEFIVGVVDAALAAQSALIAAESLGLGGVCIGAMRNLPEQVAEALKLPPHVFAVFGMAIGWPDAAQATDIKPRLPQRAVLHRETYDAAAARDAVEAYNAIMRGFQQEQGMRVADWTQQCINRVKDAAALRGRDRMREALRNLGFELR